MVWRLGREQSTLMSTTSLLLQFDLKVSSVDTGIDTRQSFQSMKYEPKVLVSEVWLPSGWCGGPDIVLSKAS